MTYNWLIVSPAWDERCISAFVDKALPAIKAAAARIGGTIRFMVHTNDSRRIKQALDQFPHLVGPIPKGQPNRYVVLGNCHRAALEETKHGECLAFVNADMILSVEAFEAAEKRFAQGKRMIMMAATRTLGGEPPIAARSAELLQWTMANRHPIVVEGFWGSGRSLVPATIYFQSGDDIVMHGFHVHPFAVMKDRNLVFMRKTIDHDLPVNFTEEEIHLVTNADEAALAELSPPFHALKLGEIMTVESIVTWAKPTAMPRHRYVFQQRITICGSGQDIGDGEICDEILRRL